MNHLLKFDFKSSSYNRFINIFLIKMSRISNCIIRIAQEAIGTPFLKYGRQNKKWLDCFGLIIFCSEKLKLPSISGGFIYQYDVLNYNFRDNEKLLLDFFNRHFTKAVSLKDANFIIFRISEKQYHVAIKGKFGAQHTVIHSFFPARLVVEHSLTNYWIEKIHSIFKV